MHQQRTLAPSALRYAVRALVLLGGALVFWLFLSGGPAQASDDPPAPVVDQVVQAATQPVRDAGTTADQAGAALRQAPTQTSAEVADVVETAPTPVSGNVEILVGTAQPVLDPTAAVVADTLASFVRTTEAVVDQTVQAVQKAPVGRTTKAPTNAATARTARPASQHPKQQPVPSTTARPGTLRGVAGSVQPVRLFSATTSAGPAVPAGNVPSGSVPSVPVAPSSSAGSSSPAGLVAGLVLFPMTLALRRRSQADADLPVGPAYPPGTSPG